MLSGSDCNSTDDAGDWFMKKIGVSRQTSANTHRIPSSAKLPRGPVLSHGPLQLHGR